MAEYKLSTAVVFIIFNRPDVTERVFYEIAKAKPPKLLVIGDGPRGNVPGEEERVLNARAILKRVNWDCEVLTNFSEKNLGCKKRVSSGLDWAFGLVDEAIILEDDCLPHQSFFRFCEELLEKYRGDERIGMISGNNFQFGHRYNSDSYYFSNLNHIWGWASWRSRWQNDYDVDMKKWAKLRNSERLNDLFRTKSEQVYLKKIYDKVYNGEIDTWDYQWSFATRIGGRMSIIPNHNLVSNIGFGEQATHTISHSSMANIENESMIFPLKHPKFMFINHELDYRFNRKFENKTFLNKLMTKFKKFFINKNYD